MARAAPAALVRVTAFASPICLRVKSVMASRMGTGIETRSRGKRSWLGAGLGLAFRGKRA